MPPKPPLPEPLNVLYRIKRGLTGYVSYLAACEMNTAFSEYVLYEPVLRILTARGYSARCEVISPGLVQAHSGDRKRIDFEAQGHCLHFALEVKWARKRKMDVGNDYKKLVAFRNSIAGARSFLCVFGRESSLKSISLKLGSRCLPTLVLRSTGAEYSRRGLTTRPCRRAAR
jgi:hypothetical protein